MSDATYNGWTNYPTWAVHLWLTNDEKLQNESTILVRDAFTLDLRMADYGNPKDNEHSARTAAADHLKGWVEEVTDLSDPSVVTGDSRPLVGMVSDLYTWALGQVNWHEIVHAFLDN